MLAVTVITFCVTVFLYAEIPKGFFPQQDTGSLSGTTDTAQDISFKALVRLQDQMARIVLADEAVETLGSYVGATSGRMFITLKPRASALEESPPNRSSPACAKKPPASRGPL